MGCLQITPEEVGRDRLTKQYSKPGILVAVAPADNHTPTALPCNTPVICFECYESD